jgi:hypothetical protein
MKELIENRPELFPCRRENMKYQERIASSINYLGWIAGHFDSLGAHNPYTEHVKIILQQVKEMERIHRPIKARMIYDENEEERNELEWQMRSDTSCDGIETFIPYLLYGCGANCYKEQYAGRNCEDLYDYEEQAKWVGGGVNIYEEQVGKEV